MEPTLLKNSEEFNFVNVGEYRKNLVGAIYTVV